MTGGNWGASNVDLDKLQEGANATTEKVQFESKLETYLHEQLKGLNERDTQSIQIHLDNLKAAIENDIEGTTDLLFGGSIEKHTYANGISDADMLVYLNASEYEGKSPVEVINDFAEKIKQRLPKSEVIVGDLAVTVKYSDGHDIQLLPAIRTTTGVRIAEPNGASWSNVIKPKAFSQKLTKINKDLNGKLIPLIKLAKVMNDKLPKSLRLSGYHIESLAIEAFRGTKGAMPYREMVNDFWEKSTINVLSPIKDSTGQSINVDDYLGNKNSTQRKSISKALSNICRKIDAANRTKSQERWKEMLEL